VPSAISTSGRGKLLGSSTVFRGARDERPLSGCRIATELAYDGPSQENSLHGKEWNGVGLRSQSVKSLLSQIVPQ